MTSRSARAAVLLSAVALAVGIATARSQTKTQDAVPQIEPRFTRVFGSDTVEIWFAQASPNGRWIVYSHQTGAESTAGLRLISVEGGEPIELTSGSWDVRPHWFPSSDRIAFQSNAVDGIMTIAIDPETGAPAGPAKRVTIEPAFGPSPVSPDGQWIAYRVWAYEGAEQGMALKIVPARGGSARTVVRLPRKPQLGFWSKDSRYLYFLWRDPADAPARLRRVALDGGEPEVVDQVPSGPSGPTPQFRPSPAGPTASGGDLTYEIQTWDERPIARVALPADMRVSGFTADGRYAVAIVRNTVNPLRVLPVAGGTMRQIGDARAHDIPIGWTPDGQRVIYQTRLDGRVAMLAVPAEGGAAQEYTIIPNLHVNAYRTPVILSESAQYLAYLGPAEGEVNPLNIARVSDGEVRQVSDSALLRLLGLTFPGGGRTKGDEFLFMEKHGDRRELRAVSFEGPSRLIRSFRDDVGTRPAWAVFEERVAWLEAAGDSVAILIADGPDAPARRLALVDGLFDDMAFSPDGRWLAGAFYLSDAKDYFKILLIPLTEDGRAASAPRMIDTQIGVGWGIRWLPDSKALTIFAQTLPDYGTDVWLFPIRDGGEPVAITRDETSEFWYYQLSPDGRYIAYPGEIQRGSSIWMVDLGSALAARGR